MQKNQAREYQKMCLEEIKFARKKHQYLFANGYILNSVQT